MTMVRWVVTPLPLLRMTARFPVPFLALAEVELEEMAVVVDLVGVVMR